jgi:hypothetical protein
MGGGVLDGDLVTSLAGLSGLLTDHRSLRETLIEIADFAVQAIPGADGAGLTMLEDARAQTVVASADFVHAVDDVQYCLGEGPCLLAVESRATFIAPTTRSGSSSGSFTGGVGEHAPALRGSAAALSGYLGVAVDGRLNTGARLIDSGDPNVDISADGAAVRTLVVRSREDLRIAAGVEQALGVSAPAVRA